MPFRPSEEIMEACYTIHEEVRKGQQADRDRVRDGGAVRERHEQVVVQSLDGPAEVDRGMASLLRRLWSCGINTHMSCEDNMGSTWICFELREFKRLHRMSRSLDDLAFFVDSCYYTFSCRTPEHATWEFLDSYEEGESLLLPPEYHVSMRFPRRLHKTFERLLCDMLDAEVVLAEQREERATRRRRVRE
jgi:hypothetical protein